MRPSTITIVALLLLMMGSGPACTLASVCIGECEAGATPDEGDETASADGLGTDTTGNVFDTDPTAGTAGGPTASGPTATMDGGTIGSAGSGDATDGATQDTDTEGSDTDGGSDSTSTGADDAGTTAADGGSSGG